MRHLPAPSTALFHEAAEQTAPCQRWCRAGEVGRCACTHPTRSHPSYKHPPAAANAQILISIYSYPSDASRPRWRSRPRSARHPQNAKPWPCWGQGESWGRSLWVCDFGAGQAEELKPGRQNSQANMGTASPISRRQALLWQTLFNRDTGLAPPAPQIHLIQRSCSLLTMERGCTELQGLVPLPRKGSALCGTGTTTQAGTGGSMGSFGALSTCPPPQEAREALRRAQLSDRFRLQPSGATRGTGRSQGL